METIGLILGIIGAIAGIYGILDYRKNHVEKPKQEKEHLKVQFMATRTLSIDVKNRLEEYARRRDAYDSLLFPGITVKAYLAGLEESQNGNLSESLLKQTDDLPLSSANMEAMRKSLETQTDALLEIQSWLKLQELSS